MSSGGGARGEMTELRRRRSRYVLSTSTAAGTGISVCMCRSIIYAHYVYFPASLRKPAAQPTSPR